MGFKDERIDYTSFLRDKPQETDPEKLAPMKEAVVKALQERDVHGHISCTYYQDGCICIAVDGEYYGVFDSRKGEFFSGYAGD